jgi:hypothetical protein
VLVGKRSGAPSVRGWRAAFAVCLVALLGTTGALAPHFTSSTELVRMRNALLMQDDSDARFDWTPAAIPADFLLERHSPDPRFAAAVREMHLEKLGSDWDRALAIGSHLLSRVTPRSGGPIQSDLNTTYQRIVDKGQGYCGDFVDVFTGLALAAGIPVRAWAFSFDGFGGHGHIFNEIWDRDAGKWKMIDVFNNYYFVGPEGTPLSALEFRSALQRNAPGLRMLPVDARAPPGYRHEDKAWDYYRRGLPEWYLWWGNNVFSYDRSPFVRTLGGASRSLEQLGGIAAGVHPGIKVLPSADNAPQRQSMQRLRMHLLAVVALAVLTLLLLAAWLANRWWTRAS